MTEMKALNYETFLLKLNKSKIGQSKKNSLHFFRSTNIHLSDFIRKFDDTKMCDTKNN